MKKKRMQSYQNVMEGLVQAEVQKQLRKQPLNLREYIDPLEVETFALNRLPALYASSQRGKEKQELQAKRKYQRDIEKAVHQGFMAVHRDPLRSAEPLPASDLEDSDLMEILAEIENFLKHKNLLRYSHLSWANLLDSIRYAVNQSSQFPITSQHKEESVKRFKSWQKQRKESRLSNLGDWSDPRYHI